MPPLPETLTLHGASVQLRDWQESDAPALETVCGDWDVCQFTSVPWSYSLAAATDWIVRNREKRSRGEVLSLAIAEPNRGAAVGNVNLVRFSADGQQAALGYWLVPSARGRGLASAAATTLAAWGFETMGLKRIELAILPDNIPSRRVAERLGATPEGLRQESHEAGGRQWDMDIFALSPSKR